MDAILRAISFADQAHAGQERKISHTPYVVHPVAVGLILQSMHCSTDCIIAGILHDVLEDTSVGPATIEAQFGSTVLELVRSVSEDKATHDWRERKEAYLATKGAAGLETKLIGAADKYHNLFSMAEDYQTYGETIWTKFKRGQTDQAWYYRTAYRVLSQGIPAEQYFVFAKIEDLLNRLFPD